MKTLPNTTPLRWLMLCIGLLFAFLCHGIAAPDILQIEKSADLTQASIRDNQWIKFRLRYNCSSTTQNAANAKITDDIDANLEIMGLIGSIHTTASDYNAGTRKVTFTFKNPLPAGSTGEVFIQARFKSTTPGNTIAYNKAQFSASNAETKTSNQVQVKGINPVTTGGGTGTLVFAKGIRLVKNASGDTVNAQAGWTDWYIRHGNTGASGQNVPNYTIEDTFPAGTMLDHFMPEKWNGTNQAVTVSYKTNKNASYRNWGSGSRYHTGIGDTWIYPSELNLTTGEYVTALRFSYGTLPGGGAFHPNTMNRLLKITTRIINPATFVAGQKVNNCATAKATGETTTTGCDDVTVSVPTASYGFWHWVSTNTAPYEMNESIRFTASMGINAESTTDLENPSIGVLLPKEVEYIGNASISGWAYDLAGKPTPKFEKIDNFKGTGRTLVRWLWGPSSNNGWKMKAERDWKYMDVYFDAKVKQWTPNGNYQSSVYGSWTPSGQGHWWFETDTEDWNGNGNVAELRARQDTTVNVETAGGSAGFDSQMFVKGELDSNWTKYPDKGLTVPGGKADYQIKFKNPSGVVMRDLVLIDILPFVGDKGVIDLSNRGSGWSPYLAAPVTAAGATVSYSLSKNPCRNELTPGIPVGCENPNWTVTPPSDITKVKSIKIDFGATKINPGDELTITWPMRAALNAPTGGEIAWNSFGYRARRNDDGTLLLASEPIKTGIAIKPPDPPFYGDFVWNDVNRNGIQDSGEPGINGVRVELFKDNGDQKNNPAEDTLVQFTTTANDGSRDGAYLFTNIGPGNFYAVVVMPNDWAISPPNVGNNDAVDSDGEAIIYKGGRAALMPITTLTTLEDDRTWDVGVYDRSGLPSVWAMATLPDGRVVLGGRFQTSHGLARRNIVRVNKDGTVDTTFNPGSGFDGEVRSLALLADGKILAGGNFTTYNGTSAYGVALINVNGTAGTALPKPDVNSVKWVGVAPEGLYVAGAFTNIAGVPCQGIARYKLNGTLDTSFNSTKGANGTINSAAVQADGKVVIAGNFTSYAGVNRQRVARLNSNGSLDTSFDPATGASGEIFSLKMIEDGRMILTGSFNSFCGKPCNGTMRLLPNGTPDPTLLPSSLTVDSIQTTN